jgi:hypothetical protein
MLNQRWNNRRDSYRPSGEVIDTRLYEVSSLDEANAKAFVITNHYSGSYPAARFRFGLYRGDQLCGTAVFSHPCNDLVLTNVFRCDATNAVELGRFVLLDSVAANGETWFLGRCFESLRKHDLNGVTTFSDPVPRRAADGRLVHPGHIGTIFQAFNGAYLGRGTPRTLRLLPDGRVLSDRAIQKIRAGERGWRYAARLLEEAGATAPDGDRVAWLKLWLPRLTRTVRHPGNHRYAWPLNKVASRLMPQTYAYPKFSPLFPELTVRNKYLDQGEGAWRGVL